MLPTRDAWLRRPSLDDLLARVQPESPDRAGPELKRSLGLVHLASIGIGATVGTGIFFVLSSATPEAGPAVLVSFLLAAVTAGLTALCYAELASMAPVSGSSYSYAYVTLGEAPAVGVAACLLLEYLVSSAAVSVGWSEYVNALLRLTLDVQLPAVLSAGPAEGGVLNLPAVVLVGLCAVLLVRGTTESAVVNTLMVLLKIVALLFFAVIALTAFSVDRFAEFAPFGMAGIGAAAGTVFFSFIGIDAISTAGAEVRDPQRTVPRAMMVCLAVVTVLYLLVALAAVGAQPWTRFDGQEAGLAAILTEVTGAGWPSIALAVGAVISIFSVTLVTLYGQTRILFTMGRDGLLPPALARVHPRTRTPILATVLTAVGAAVLAGLVPLDDLADLVSMGTLTAFTVVSIAVIILRVRDPHADRPFRTPLFPLVPVLSVLACVYLIAGLGWLTIAVFVGWLAVALLGWTFYGSARSRLADHVVTPGHRDGTDTFEGPRS